MKKGRHIKKKNRNKRFIKLEHELCILFEQIDWGSVEHEFSDYFSEIERPSVPIRRMVGLVLLKQIYNLSDEVIVERWIENSYWQYFSGEKFFQTQKFGKRRLIHQLVYSLLPKVYLLQE